MLSTWLRSLVTPCPRYAREMGYLQEQLCIKARYERCRRGWDPHLEKTKQILCQAIERCPSRRKAVLFGSGMLLDIPLAELTKAFREVILVDVVHPFGTGWRLGTAVALAADVTGVAEQVYQIAHKGGKPLPQSTPTLFLDDPEVDLIASVNLLSQLPYIPCKYLSEAGHYDKADIEAFARHLVRAHIDYLPRLPGVVTLICDLERLTVDESGNLVERLTALRGETLPWHGEEWIWDLAPRPEASPRFSYQRRVAGIVNIKEPNPLIK